MEGAFPSY